MITSVNRDELPDGGAAIFAGTIRAIRERCPETSIEVLIPDFEGDWDALEVVMEARPDILNHNIESIARLYQRRATAGEVSTARWSCSGAPRRWRRGSSPSPG